MMLLCILSESYLCDRQFICLVKSKQYHIYKLEDCWLRKDLFYLLYFYERDYLFLTIENLLI